MPRTPSHPAPPSDLLDSPVPLRVLLVEDEPSVRVPLARGLAMRGFEVETATRGAEVLARMETFQPAVVLLDVGLPDMSGLAVIEILLARDPLVSVVMLSGAGEGEVGRLALAAGATEFVVKPVTLTDVADAVRRAASRIPVRAPAVRS